MNVKTQRRKAQESDSHHDVQQRFRLRLGLCIGSLPFINYFRDSCRKAALLEVRYLLGKHAVFCSGCPLDDFILCVFFFTSEPRSKSLVADIMYIIIVYIYISKYTFCSKGTSSGMTHTCMVHRNYINHETIQSLLRTHSHVKLIRRGWVRSGQARQLAQKKARVHHHKQRLGIGVSAWRPLKAMW